MSEKKILIVSDCPTLNTGYARVGRFVAQTLHDNGYKVSYLPCNSTMAESTRKFDYQVFPFDPLQRYNIRRLRDLLTQMKPSLVMVFGEFQYVGYIGNVCRQMGVLSLYYLPVEGRGYPPQHVYTGGGMIDFRLTLAKFHYIVAYSEFGKTEIHRTLPGIVTEAIPHAIDTKIFRPLDKKACLYSIFPGFKEDPNLNFEKVFVVGAVYRNHRRKGIDYLLKGFKHFLQYEEPNRKSILFMLTDPKDPSGYNLHDMIERMYGLSGRVVVSPVVGGSYGPEDNVMAEIYNAMDTHCCPFRGEGFGYPLLESAACGVKTIATNYATPSEYGKDVFEFIPVFDHEPIVSTNCEWAVLDPREVGEAIARVYKTNTKTVHQPSADMARAYSESIIAKRWLALLSDLNLPDGVNINDNSIGNSAQTQFVDDYFQSINS